MNKKLLSIISNINTKEQLKKLNEFNIPFIVLKGVFLNDLYFSLKHYKISNDIDIYLEKNDLKKFSETLIKNGYTTEWSTDLALEYINNKNYKTFGGNHMPTFNHSNKLATDIELHFSISPNYYGDFGLSCINSTMEDVDLFSHTIDITYDNYSFKILNPTYQFLVLLLHYSSHIKVMLHNYLNQYNDIDNFTTLLTELYIYYSSYYKEIDIDLIFKISEKHFRYFDVFLPINLLNYKYKLNINIYNSIKFITNNEQSIIGKYFNEISTIPPNIWLSNNINTEINKLLLNKSNFNKIKTIDGIAIFNIKTLKGIRYDQYTIKQQNIKGKINLSENLILEFFNIDFTEIMNDYNFYKNLSPEKGNGGIYLSFYNLHDNKYDNLKTTYLLKVENNKVYLLGLDEYNEYNKTFNIEFELNKIEGNYNILIKFPKKLITLNKSEGIGFMAYLSAYEPYFHLNNILNYDIYY